MITDASAHAYDLQTHPTHLLCDRVSQYSDGEQIRMQVRKVPTKKYKKDEHSETFQGKMC